MKNHGKQSDAERNLILNLTYHILHVAYEKDTHAEGAYANFADFVAGANNCVNANGEVSARSAYSGTRYVRRCADNSIEPLATKGMLSPEMIFDAELTFQYWKYKGNYGVAASIHRIIAVICPDKPTFISGATNYGPAQ